MEGALDLFRDLTGDDDGDGGRVRTPRDLLEEPEGIVHTQVQIENDEINGLILYRVEPLSGLVHLHELVARSL